MLIQNIEHSYIVVLRKYTNFVRFYSHETRNVFLVRLMQIYKAKQVMQTNMTNVVANSYTSLSAQSPKCYFKININKVPLKKRKSVKSGLVFLAEQRFFYCSYIFLLLRP